MSLAMSEYTEVSFHVLFNVNECGPVPDFIMDSIREMGGIITIAHANNSNAVYISARWNESETVEKIRQIQKIEHVIGIRDIKRTRHVTRGLKENVPLSESAVWNVVKNPINEISKAKEDRDYFKAMTYSCAVFEYYGKQILVWHFNDIKRPIGKSKLERMSLNPVIMMLYTHEIINESVYNDMIQVKELRNKFIHEDRSVKISSEQFIDSNKNPDKMVDKALGCAIFLKAKYESMVT